MNYAKAMRILRAAKGISQQELARKAEISKSLLSKIESGQRELTNRNKSKIARAMQIPISLLNILAIEAGYKKISKHDLEQLGRTLLTINKQIESLKSEKEIQK